MRGLQKSNLINDKSFEPPRRADLAKTIDIPQKIMSDNIADITGNYWFSYIVMNFDLIFRSIWMKSDLLSWNQINTWQYRKTDNFRFISAILSDINFLTDIDSFPDQLVEALRMSYHLSNLIFVEISKVHWHLKLIKSLFFLGRIVLISYFYIE